MISVSRRIPVFCRTVCLAVSMRRKTQQGHHTVNELGRIDFSPANFPVPDIFTFNKVLSVIPGNFQRVVEFFHCSGGGTVEILMELFKFSVHIVVSVPHQFHSYVKVDTVIHPVCPALDTDTVGIDVGKFNDTSGNVIAVNEIDLFQLAGPEGRGTVSAPSVTGAVPVFPDIKFCTGDTPFIDQIAP